MLLEIIYSRTLNFGLNYLNMFFILQTVQLQLVCETAYFCVLVPCHITCSGRLELRVHFLNLSVLKQSFELNFNFHMQITLWNFQIYYWCI